MTTSVDQQTEICNNQGLLIWIEEAKDWDYMTPNVMLRAEWDIKSVILTIYKELDMQFVLLHMWKVAKMTTSQ